MSGNSNISIILVLTSNIRLLKIQSGIFLVLGVRHDCVQLKSGHFFVMVSDFGSYLKFVFSVSSERKKGNVALLLPDGDRSVGSALGLY